MMEFIGDWLGDFNIIDVLRNPRSFIRPLMLFSLFAGAIGIIAARMRAPKDTTDYGPQPDYWKCPQCGHVNSPDALTCGKCGNTIARVDDYYWECPECKRINPGLSHTCAGCGAAEPDMKNDYHWMCLRCQTYNPPESAECKKCYWPREE
ncbi:hypothetical protein FACS18949_11350 [Clostridia bacterium]|nr:hypothetical protein FACS18949_11350 [Clostridia bacterium]